jgi:hypothetical protein
MLYHFYIKINSINCGIMLLPRLCCRFVYVYLSMYSVQLRLRFPRWRGVLLAVALSALRITLWSALGIFKLFSILHYGRWFSSGTLIFSTINVAVTIYLNYCCCGVDPKIVKWWIIINLNSCEIIEMARIYIGWICLKSSNILLFKALHYFFKRSWILLVIHKKEF